ncbi:MAG TPA: hypothetical protein VIL30_17215 [Ramlibacter sp.]
MLIDVIYWTLNAVLWLMGLLCLLLFVLMAAGPKHQRTWDWHGLVGWLFAWTCASVPWLDRWFP